MRHQLQLNAFDILLYMNREIAGVPPAVFPGDSTIISVGLPPSPCPISSEGLRAKGLSIARDKNKLTEIQRIRYHIVMHTL